MNTTRFEVRDADLGDVIFGDLRSQSVATKLGRDEAHDGRNVAIVRIEQLDALTRQRTVARIARLR